MTFLSVVVPAFDEARRIDPPLRALAAALEHARLAFELVVSDDGSSDDTVGVCRGLGLPNLRVVGSAVNEGKGAAVRRGMLAATGEVRAFVDADGSASPSALPGLVAEVASGRSDVAIASRYVGGARPHGQPLARVAFSRACHRIIEATLLPGIADPYCGMKVFSKAAAQAVFGAQRARLWAFDVEGLARAHRAGFRITEHPVPWRDDGRSTVRWHHAWPTLREAIQIPGWLREDTR